MKLLSLILFWGIVQGTLSDLLPRNECNADNCARAVTGTRPGKLPVVSVRRADCSSFMLITVTPALSTAVLTETITSTTTLPVVAKRGNAVLAVRQVTVSPASIPTYASACSGTARYSSACSCWGITQTITTAPTPVTTITSTVTITASVCPAGDTKCGGSCANLKTSNSHCGTCGNVSCCPCADALEKCSPGTACQSGTCKILGTCNNPTVCTGNDSCGSAPGQGECFCHPDSNGIGYCHSSTQCTGLVSCNKNNDCAKGSVCVDNCCGKVCRPIQPVCANPIVKSRIFRKRDGEQWTDPI